MSGDTSAFGFGKFIPGFDFLQGLAQSAGSGANPMGRVPQWVAPTVSVEEVDKRIAELKAVQFWLEQNGRALAATIQALEVQRMTLSTLQGMNVSMSELAKSFQFPAGVMPNAEAAQPAGFTGWPMGDGATKAPDAKPEVAPEVTPEPQPQPKAEQQDEQHAAPETEPASAAAAEEAAASVQQQTQAAMGQAMQWWGALTQQFQQIAAKAMAEPVPAETMAAAQRATEAASGFAKSAMEKVMAKTSAFTSPAQAAEDKAEAAKSTPRPTAKKSATPKAAVKATAKSAAKPATKAATKTAPKAAAKKPARKAAAPRKS